VPDPPLGIVAPVGRFTAQVPQKVRRKESHMGSVARIFNLTEQVREVLEEISGQDVSADPPELSFIEQGFDSLILTQVALACSKRFGVDVKLRHLVDETPSCGALVQYLDQHVKPGLYDEAAAPS